MDVDFLAKIDSVQFRQVDQQVKVGVDLDASASWGWGSAKLKASFAFQRDTKEGTKDTRTYSMGVKAKATQEEVPGGLSRVLTILTALADLVGDLGAGLVFGRAQADHASVEVMDLYRQEPLLQGVRMPRMVLSEVTIEVRFAPVAVDGRRVEVLVTVDELAKARPEQISTLTLKFTEDDLEPPPPPTG